MQYYCFPFIGSAIAREITMETPNRRPDRCIYDLGWKIDIFAVGTNMVLIQHHIWGVEFPNLQHLALRSSFEFDPLTKNESVHEQCN